MSPGQRETVRLWPESKLLFLIGPAGTGKTHAAMALALRQHIDFNHPLFLSRPMVSCDDEEMGFLPGDVNEKFAPWMAPFSDVAFGMIHGKLSDLPRIEYLPIGLLRGRTIRAGTLIIDEAQNLSASQIRCAATRVGEHGRVVLCGDPWQSDRHEPKASPLVAAWKTLRGIPGVNLVHFNKPEDVIRSGFVSDVLTAYRKGS